MIRSVLLAACALAGAGAAHAAPTYFTDRAAFTAAVTALGAAPTVETFEGAPASGFVGTTLPDQNATTAAFDFDFGAFTLFAGRFQGVSGPFPDNSVFTGFAFFGAPLTRTFGFAFDAPVIAFGLDLEGLPASVLFDAAQPVGDGFFGVIADAPTTMFTLVLASGATVLSPVTIDNVTFAFAPAAPVPAPAAFALLGLGTLAAARRRG